MILIYLIIIAGGVIYACFCEWTLHRYFMHAPFCGFRYPFEAHALTHHRVFKSDDTYHVQNDADKKTIPMKWWNGPAIVAVCAVPVAVISWISGMRSIIIIVPLVSLAYYAAYEYSHWCMHLPLPKRRIIESWPIIGWIFYRLNGHHLLHHRYMHKNYNVVLPFADLCLGTLLLRSKTHFKQARGHSVPDVQPRQKKT